MTPGGRLYLVTDTPYAGPWKVKSAEYEQRKANGDEWPGFYTNYAQFLPPGTDPAEHPDFINVMDPDVLARVCRGAGLEVIEAAWLAGGTRFATERDHAGVIAIKP